MARTGSNLETIGEIPERQLLEELHAEIQPVRLKCALLPFGVLQSGVNAYRQSRRPQ